MATLALIISIVGFVISQFALILTIFTTLRTRQLDDDLNDNDDDI